ncbi:MAG: porin family protein [Rickettsiales bacterium]|jgi:opacity protein-like surface antigen|nr:porin family protein [Rickettsiales bacterium]
MKNVAICSLMIVVCASAAQARVDYRAQATKNAIAKEESETSTSFAAAKRFYVKGDFVTAWWQNAAPGMPGTIYGLEERGGFDTSFDAGIGVRAADWFRAEFEYYRFTADYGVDIGGIYSNNISIDGDAFMLNAIFDARMDSKYSFLTRQFFVPFAGFGIGVSHNSLNRNSLNPGDTLDRKYTPVAAAIMGVAIEFNKTFSIDVGYRYFYMFSPKIDSAMFGDHAIVPNGHQLRVGAKINF